VVGEILEAEGGLIDSTVAINLGRSLTSAKLTAPEAERCLEKLEGGGWIAKDDEGNFCLGVRTELQQRYTSVDFEAPAAKDEVTEELE
jgi:hypothetical protein